MNSHSANVARQRVPRLPPCSAAILQIILPTAVTRSAPLGWPAFGDLIPATTDILSIVSRNPIETGFLKYRVQGTSSFCTGARGAAPNNGLQWKRQGETEENYPGLGSGFAQGKFTHVFPCKVAQWILISLGSSAKSLNKNVNFWLPGNVPYI